MIVLTLLDEVKVKLYQCCFLYLCGAMTLEIPINQSHHITYTPPFSSRLRPQCPIDIAQPQQTLSLLHEPQWWGEAGLGVTVLNVIVLSPCCVRQEQTLCIGIVCALLLLNLSCLSSLSTSLFPSSSFIAISIIVFCCWEYFEFLTENVCVCGVGVCVGRCCIPV